MRRSSPRARRLAAAINREQRQAESQGLTLARGAFTRMRGLVLNGKSVEQAFELSRVASALLTPMAYAELLGAKRAKDVAARLVRAPFALAGSSSGDKADRIIREAGAKLGLGEDQLDALRDRYAGRAQGNAERMARSLNRSIDNALKDGAGNPQAAIRDGFDRAGLGAKDDWQLRTIIATEVQRAYAGGRERALKENGAWEELWGFEFVAIIDSRSSEICPPLDGTVLPKDDPFWDVWSPPNHYNCRSHKAEVFEKGDEERPDEDELEDPEEGFDGNPADE